MKRQGKGTTQIFLILAKIMFVVECLMNVFLPVLTNKSFGFGWIHLSVIVVCVYAQLGCFGYVKKVVDIDEDGTIRYESVVPIVQFVIIRLFEGSYHALRHGDIFNKYAFLVLLFVDIVYLLILLFDKSNYYYESKKSED